MDGSFFLSLLTLLRAGRSKGVREGRAFSKRDSRVGPGFPACTMLYGTRARPCLSIAANRSTFAMNMKLQFSFFPSHLIAQIASIHYRGGNKGLYILLSRTQAGPGRTVKQEQEEISRNHVPRLYFPLCTSFFLGPCM